MSERCERCGQAVPSMLGIVADGERGEVRFNGFAAHVSRQEFEILNFLLEKKGGVATKEAIYDRLYQLESSEVQPKIVDVFVCKLRKKIEPMGLRIGTAWGRGYFIDKPAAVAA